MQVRMWIEQHAGGVPPRIGPAARGDGEAPGDHFRVAVRGMEREAGREAQLRASRREGCGYCGIERFFPMVARGGGICPWIQEDRGREPFRSCGHGQASPSAGDVDVLTRRNQMRKVLMFLIVMVLLWSADSRAAICTWAAPTNYAPVPPATVGDPIPSAKIATITYKVYSGSSAIGPWSLMTTTGAGVLSATLLDPAPGGTLCCTLEAVLDGQTSAKASPACKAFPQKTPEG